MRVFGLDLTGFANFKKTFILPPFFVYSRNNFFSINVNYSLQL